ncbi:MAG: prepilin-type N-terminal cleavage/methylation domain-containing protein [Usitatibacter sp.]
MKSQQSGFTLVEIAIVLVIIGLLLGGILKGQELINSAKVKNIANDFRVIPTYIYAYQDKFKSLPGDDAAVATHITGSTLSTVGPTGNGVINGAWNAAAGSGEESALFWQHVRLANLASGPTDVTDATYLPTNATGGKIGLSSATSTTTQIQGMTGTYQICSAGILGKFAKQLDIQMDDGNTSTGSMRTVADGAGMGTAAIPNNVAPPAGIDDAASYTVCMTF